MPPHFPRAQSNHKDDDVVRLGPFVPLSRRQWTDEELCDSRQGELFGQIAPGRGDRTLATLLLNGFDCFSRRGQSLPADTAVGERAGS